MITNEPLEALRYTTGTLDTLSYIGENGLPEERIVNCVFNGQPWNYLIGEWMDYMVAASHEAVNNNRSGLTPAETFFAKLEEDCP